MRIVIFGGSGQLGSEWSRHLEETGVPFHSFSSSEIDITVQNQVEETVMSLQPDIILNCAAFTKVDLAESERAKAELINADAVGALAHICREHGVKLVHYSTDYIFSGRAEDRKRYPEGYPEDHPTSPINWYGKTKLEGEKKIRDSGVSHLIVRTSWVCGAFGSNFVKTMIRLAGEKDHLDVVNDQWGCPSFTKNIVRNTMNLVEKQKEGIYNITSRGLITWYDLAVKIFEMKGMDIRVNPVSSDEFKTIARRPYFSKLDTRKLSEVQDSEIVFWEKGLGELLAQLSNE